MPDGPDPQLLHISTQIDDIIRLLREKNETMDMSQSFPEELRDLLESGRPPLDRDKDGEVSNEEPRKVVKESDPVSITSITPNTLNNLAAAIQEKDTERDIVRQQQRGSFIDALIGTIGVPLLALAGGITALLSSANIDFGAFEGMANILGKYGFKEGFKMFLKPFANLISLKLLKRIPVIGGLVSFYTAKERFDKGQALRGTMDLVSGFLNLVPTGITQVLSFGLDVLTAVLDYKAGKEPITTDDVSDWFTTLPEKIWNVVGPTIHNVPIIGALFRGKTVMDLFTSNNITGAMSALAGVASSLFPGPIGYVVSSGLKVIQGLFSSPERRTPEAQEAINFYEKMSEGMMSKAGDWYQSLDDGVFKEMVDWTLEGTDFLAAMQRGNVSKAKIPQQPEFVSFRYKAYGTNRNIAETSTGRKIDLSDEGLRRLNLSDLNELLMLKDWRPEEIDRINRIINEKKNPVTDLEKKMAGKGSRTLNTTGIQSEETDMAVQGRADGGVIRPGITYLTGERGPELVQTAQTGIVHSNEDIVGLLRQNNEILANLSQEIVIAITETGTVINNSTSSNVVNNTVGESDIRSFREKVKSTIY